ncbi:RrF2 family transcriptional regulator [Enterovirga rhinocerotis]|uniref:BadM/Rrf2 family transcriptional regulator n=1 Tax=Enterovirga rhinocerotis TaxID=1339210 RepID=A0A4R7C232_9HYPH|nr:Rrf2 family transcriptional regulator [Enterovirga rhinocerotis]TDR90476.1 BadM/Rrf2 family transcriptional regulator [Enterovirga rhinocerotis]
MNLLPRRSLLAIAAVIDIALHARPRPVSAKALAARHQLGPRHLEGVLHALVQAGILKGLRGPRGGYELARERRRITVGEIVRATERQPPEGEQHSDLIEEVVAPALNDAAEAYLVALDAITVAQLCSKAAEAGLDGQQVAATDFTI